jgi:hypothetical protein
LKSAVPAREEIAAPGKSGSRGLQGRCALPIVPVVIRASVLLVVLAGCSLTLPVRGRIEGTNAMLVGEATGYMDGSGKLHMLGSDGRDCTGAFQYADTRRSGTGTLRCTDGVTGTFAFNSTGDQGTGFGRTSKGERFRFVFGRQSAVNFAE